MKLVRSDGQSSQAYRSWIQTRWSSAKAEKGADRAGKHSTFVQPSWRTVSLCRPAAEFCWNTMSWLFPLSDMKTERVVSHRPESKRNRVCLCVCVRVRVCVWRALARVCIRLTAMLFVFVFFVDFFFLEWSVKEKVEGLVFWSHTHFKHRSTNFCM